MIILRIFIFIYGVLTSLAVVEEARATQLQWSHGIYILFSLALIFVSIRTGPDWLLYVGLIGLIIWAGAMGILTDTFQWSHIIVRVVITIVVIVLWIRL